MFKSAHLSSSVKSSTLCCQRGLRLHHHDGGVWQVICVFCVVSDSWLVSWTHHTIILEVLLCDQEEKFKAAPPPKINWRERKRWTKTIQWWISLLMPKSLAMEPQSVTTSLTPSWSVSLNQFIFLQARAWQQRSKTNQSESHSQDYQTPSSKSHKSPIVNNPPKGQSFVDLSKKQSTKLPLILRSISNHLKTGWMLLPWSKPRKLWQKWERMRKAIGKNLQRASTGRRAKLPPQVIHLRRCLQIPAHPLKAPTTMLPPETTTKRSQRRITSCSMGKRTGSISSRTNKLNSWWRWQILQETTSEKHLEAWSAT